MRALMIVFDGEDKILMQESYPLPDLDSAKIRITVADYNNVWRTIEAKDLHPKGVWRPRHKKTKR